jgi:hypothetical protein
VTHHRNIVEQMDKVAQINRYHVEQFGKWIATLKAAEDGERSVLDNSMIVDGPASPTATRTRTTTCRRSLPGAPAASSSQDAASSTGRRRRCATCS